MRRVKISFFLIIFILIYSVSSLFILKSCNNKLKSRVEQIQRVYESGDTEGALQLSNEMNDYWHRYEKTVTMIIHDDTLGELNSSIARITPFIANENEELIAEIQSIYHQIDQIYEEEFPAWYNIL